MSNDTFSSDSYYYSPPKKKYVAPKPPKPSEEMKQKIFAYEPEDVTALYKSAKDAFEGEIPTSAKAEARAKKEGFEIVYPTPFQLQIDIDDEHSYNVYKAMFPLIEKYYGVEEVSDEPSRGNKKNKRHVTITLKERISRLERIALQACLGSDRVREFLGILQERNHDPHPTLLFEKEA